MPSCSFTGMPAIPSPFSFVTRATIFPSRSIMMIFVATIPLPAVLVVVLWVVTGTSSPVVVVGCVVVVTAASGSVVSPSADTGSAANCKSNSKVKISEAVFFIMYVPFCRKIVIRQLE